MIIDLWSSDMHSIVLHTASILFIAPTEMLWEAKARGTNMDSMYLLTIKHWPIAHLRHHIPHEQRLRSCELTWALLYAKLVSYLCLTRASNDDEFAIEGNHNSAYVYKKFSPVLTPLWWSTLRAWKADF